jgi:hypothetical protein
MLHICRRVALVVLLSTAVAEASYWVGDFDGSAQDYSVVRGDAPIAIEQLMLLQPGDIVIIDKPDGRVRLIEQDSKQRNLTYKDTPFVVPESDLPPRLLVNVRYWVASWWSTRGKQNTSSMAAVSKGDFEPAISAMGSGENFLLDGTRKLQLWWHGGIGPFDVSLFDQSGQLLARENNLAGYSATLPEYPFKNGRYKLEVAEDGAKSSITLTIASRRQLPPSAAAILDLDVPAEIRFGHLAMVLSAYDEWRFEALQLAQNHNLEQLSLDLLAGNFPESVFGEADSTPASIDERR